MDRAGLWITNGAKEGERHEREAWRGAGLQAELSSEGYQFGRLSCETVRAHASGSGLVRQGFGARKT